MTTETPKTADAALNGAGGGSVAGTADLDALLGEYQPGKPDKTPDVLKQLAPVITFAQTEMANRAKEGLTKDLAAAIGFVKQEEGIQAIPDRIVRGMLEVHAAEDPSFAQAFENRGKDQKAWQAKLTEARTAVANELRQLNPNTRVSSDVLAARAAISGQTPQPPESKHDAKALFAMTDQDYHRFLAGLSTAR